VRRLILTAAVAVGFVVAGCQELNEFIEPPPPTVTVATPLDEEVIVRVSFTGRTAPVESVEVRARVEGFLNEVLIEEGRFVREGDVLFTIERAPFEARVGVAEAKLAQAKAARGLAETTLERVERAKERNAASEIEVLLAEAERDAAVATVQGADADLDTAMLDLSYTTIAAPMDGRVSRRFVSEGNLVGKGEATLLTTLVVDDPIYAYFTINERDFVTEMLNRPPAREYGRFEHEVQAFLMLSDGTEYSRPGRVDFIDNTVDAATGSIQARAVFPNPDTAVLSGLFARVFIPREPKQVLLVPTSALQRDLGGSFLLTVENGEVVRNDVEVGEILHDRGLRIVLSGIEATDEIVVNGLQSARPGRKVNTEKVTIEAFIAKSLDSEPAAAETANSGAADDETSEGAAAPADGGGD
jgi:RND family efflux transporter MFP subunit